MKVKVKKVHPDARIPTYANPGDAGMDLYSVERVVIRPGHRETARIGIAFEIPKGHVGLIWDKSSLGIIHGLKVLGGVIDSGFRGEMVVTLVNLGKKSYAIEPGHKVAQMLIQKVHRPRIVAAAKLSASVRGEKKFGSSGK